jgi:hypothetical protein
MIRLIALILFLSACVTPDEQRQAYERQVHYIERYCNEYSTNRQEFNACAQREMTKLKAGQRQEYEDARALTDTFSDSANKAGTLGEPPNQRQLIHSPERCSTKYNSITQAYESVCD